MPIFKNLPELDFFIFPRSYDVWPHCTFNSAQSVHQSLVLLMDLVLSYLFLVFRDSNNSISLVKMAFGEAAYSVVFSLTDLVYFFVESFYLLFFILSKYELVLVVSIFHFLLFCYCYSSKI